MTRLLVLAVICLATPAAAEIFEPLDQTGQVGIGASLDEHRFDGNLRIGHVVRARGSLWAGGFVELHTIGFDTYDLSIGPQTQDLWAVQLRAGLGIGSDGPQVIAGAQLGTWLVGTSVTARRSFDNDATVISLNLELSALLPALPFALMVPTTR